MKNYIILACIYITSLSSFALHHWLRKECLRAGYKYPCEIGNGFWGTFASLLRWFVIIFSWWIILIIALVHLKWYWCLGLLIPCYLVAMFFIPLFIMTLVIKSRDVEKYYPEAALIIVIFETTALLLSFYWIKLIFF